MQLEIEHKLNITITMPQTCHFCSEEIMNKYGKKTKSLCFHSLDEDHDNWDPENKVPAHGGCHTSFHHKGKPHPWMEGDKHPSKRPKFRREQSERMMGDKNPSKRPEQRQRMRDHNPMKRPEIAAKVGKTIREKYRYEDHPNKGNSQIGIRGWKTRRDRGSRTNNNKKTWDTRRRLYPPNGMKQK